MRNIFRKPIFFAWILSFALVSCLPDDEEFAPEDWLGSWEVRETSGSFAPQSYTINIQGSESEGFRLNGLYAQGASFQLDINPSAGTLLIPFQQVGDFEVQGSAIMNSDLTSARLTFTMDDGSGMDQVEGQMTKR
ncbi:MAG: hypothetical protein EA358_03915 [Flavobacteriales bacterium]|nr:MAG: hypothetical protein EA358_03915 [Flavobacteriales bacterium]